MEDVTTVQANAILLGLRRVNVEPIRRSEVGTHLDQEDMESYLDGLSVVLRTRCCISRTFTTSLCGLPARTRPRHFAGVLIAPIADAVSAVRARPSSLGPQPDHESPVLHHH